MVRKLALGGSSLGWQRSWLVISVALPVLATALPASAEGRVAVELEPVTPHFSPAGHARTAISTVGVTWGFSSRTSILYVGGGLGFFTAQARLGVTWLPNDLTNASLMVRLEARPQLFLSPCQEPALFGNVGVGYRWPIEHSYPGERPGAALYVLPSFDGGEAWVRPDCAKTGSSEPLQAESYFGGTVALGMDW